MERERWIPLLLLALTLVTCTLTGAVFAYGYFESTGPVSLLSLWGDLRYLLLGLVLFALPLLAILGVHELGHYLVLRRHGLPASLPWFIPFLPFPFGISGTLGAVISIRQRIRDRSAMVRVAAAGPLVGLVAAVAVLVVGLALSDPTPLAPEAEGGSIEIQTPLLYDWLARASGVPETAAVHPIAVAGWLGLFVTSLQLIPIGQFDGGHIMRAFVGERAKWVSWGVAAALALVGLVGGFYAYLVWALIGAATEALPAIAPTGGLTWREGVLTLACLVTLGVTFAFVPISL